jgi:hypothetical protein
MKAKKNTWNKKRGITEVLCMGCMLPLFHKNSTCEKFKGQSMPTTNVMTGWRSLAGTKNCLLFW